MKTNSENVFKISNIYELAFGNLSSQIISKDRIYPTSIIAAKVFPLENISSITAFGLSTLWLFGIDRFFDERVLTLSELSLKLQNLLNACFELPTQQPPTSPEDIDLIVFFHNLDSSLKTSNYYQQYKKNLHSSLENVLLLGMLPLFKLKNASILNLTKKEYILYARESIGVKFVNWCVLVSQNILLKPEDYDYFEKLQNLSSTIIRLANDLATFPKEKKEGNVNYVHLVGLGETKSALENCRNDFKLTVQNSPSYIQQFTKYVEDLVEITLDFYSRSDFYDTKESLNKKQL